MILVTGGNGFIGKQVCSWLSQYQYEVVAVDRQFEEGGVHPKIIGDLTDPVFLDNLFKQYPFKLVIHLASMLNSASRQQPQEAMQVNMGVSLNLLELSAQFGISKFIYGSSISVYGLMPFSKYGSVSEAVPAAPNTVYGISKRYVEVVGETYQQKAPFSFVALRIATVIGPGGKSTSSPWRSDIFDKLAVTQPTTLHFPLLPSETVPLVHVDDVAEMVRLLVEATQIPHTLYNTPSESWQLGELAEFLQEVNGHLQFTFGQGVVDDIPQVVDAHQFLKSYGNPSTPLKQNLKAFKENHASHKIWVPFSKSSCYE